MRVKKWSCLMIALCLLMGALVTAFAEELQEVGSNEMADALVFEVDALEAADPEPEQAPVPNATGIALTEANFPDPSFRSYLQTECDEDGDGFLSEEEMEWYVDELYLEGRMITSLKGIELFPGLIGLECSGNLLSSLDLSGNPDLAYLDCNDNMLTSLNLSKNTKLNSLSCSNNKLISLDVSKNTDLKSLYCSENKLKSLNVAGLNKLERVYCDDNQLTTLNISQCPRLTDIHCANNQLTQLDITSDSKLHNLTCYENELTTLDLSAFDPAIQKLFTKENIEENYETLHIGNDTYYVECDDYVELTLNGKVIHPMNFKSIAFTDKEIKLEVGKTYHPSFITVPEDMHGDVTIYFDPYYVTVSKGFIVTALEKGWTTLIVETENGRYDSMDIHIVAPSIKPTIIKLDKTKAALGVKETLRLTATFAPKGASSKLTWSSSNKKIATVDKAGVITGKKAGTAKITVTTSNGKKATATITVKAAPKKVTLNKTGMLTLATGKTLQLKATLPKNTASALTWASSNEKIATVDETGKVTAVKAGTATITVQTFNGKKASVKIKVK